MRQFDTASWIDFVRGLAEFKLWRPAEGRFNSARARSRDAFRQLAATARVEASQRPPDWAIRSVRALFALQQPQDTLSFLPVRVRVAFDSTLLPVPSGVRGAAAVQRQLVYHSEDYALDVRLGPRAGDDGLTLVGEVLNRKVGPLADVPALLIAGRQTLDRTRTGSFGEFELESRGERPLRLRLLIEDARYIDVDIELPPDPEGTDPAR